MKKSTNTQPRNYNRNSWGYSPQNTSTKSNSRNKDRLKTAYADLLKVNNAAHTTTYVKYPNESKNILKKKDQDYCKVLDKAKSPIIEKAMSGLSGTLKVQMENYRPQCSTNAIRKHEESLKQSKQKSAKAIY